MTPGVLASERSSGLFRHKALNREPNILSRAPLRCTVRVPTICPPTGPTFFDLPP